MDVIVEVVSRDETQTAVVCGRVAHDGVGPFIGAAFGEVLAAIDPSTLAGPPFCRIDMHGDEFDLEVGFPVTVPVSSTGRVVGSTLPGGEVATVLHVGPYDSVAPAYFVIEQWLGEHGYLPAGAPWESYLDGPDVPQPRTLVSWPCRLA